MKKEEIDQVRKWCALNYGNGTIDTDIYNLLGKMITHVEKDIEFEKSKNEYGFALVVGMLIGGVVFKAMGVFLGAIGGIVFMYLYRRLKK